MDILSLFFVLVIDTMILFKFFWIFVWLYQFNGVALDMKSEPEKLNLSNSVFNTEILTQFIYRGNEIYIYSSIKYLLTLHNNSFTVHFAGLHLILYSSFHFIHTAQY